MNQKKTAVLVSFLILILIGVGFYFMHKNNLSANQNQETNNQVKTNILKKDAFSIKIPEGWIETKGAPGIEAMISNLQEKNQDPLVDKMKFKSYFAVAHQANPGKTLDEYVEKVKSQLSGIKNGFQIVSEKPAKTNGYDSYIIEGELKQQEAKFKAFIVIIKGLGDDVWLVTFNTALQGWERYRDTFEQTIQSFTLHKKMENQNPSSTSPQIDTKTESESNSGVKITILQQGEGVEAKDGNKVTVDYVGTLEDGTKFDSSIDRGTPFNFTLGSGQVIKGWDVGVKGMKVGEKRKLVIPSELAYGSKGVPGTIPANATLVFEVTLLKIGE